MEAAAREDEDIGIDLGCFWEERRKCTMSRMLVAMEEREGEEFERERNSREEKRKRLGTARDAQVERKMDMFLEEEVLWGIRREAGRRTFKRLIERLKMGY